MSKIVSIAKMQLEEKHINEDGYLVMLDDGWHLWFGIDNQQD